MTVLVRPAHPDELSQIGELTVQAYAEDAFVDPSDDYAHHLRDTVTRASEAELYVAVLDDRIAGTVTFCPQGSPWCEVAGPDEGEFRMLAVSSDARRQGVAGALVGVCIERARELGYAALVLSSLPQQAPAHRLYQRLGFRRTPDLDWSPADGVDLLVFRLPLRCDHRPDGRGSAPGRPPPG
jgi:GNAT superfamily N-acetyltransferase